MSHINKENNTSQQRQEQQHGLGDLGDPFEDNQRQSNMCNTGGRINHYSERKQSSSNPYQQNQQQRLTNVAQTAGRFSPMPQMPTSTNSVSPTLTNDQIRRMEENRRRALAIRMKKQNGAFT